MKKVIKGTRIILLSLCFILTTMPLVVKATVDLDIPDEGSIITISGKNFTYETAPENARLEHEKNCQAIGIIPQNDDPIFIPQEAFEQYGLNSNARYYSDAFNIYTVNSGKTIVAKDIANLKMYCLNRSQLIGYNQVNVDESVLVVQLMLNRYKGFSYVAVDGIFGPMTYNLLCQYQASKGLVSDGISGPATYDTYLSYLGY